MKFLSFPWITNATFALLLFSSTILEPAKGEADADAVAVANTTSLGDVATPSSSTAESLMGTTLREDKNSNNSTSLGDLEMPPSSSSTGESMMGTSVREDDYNEDESVASNLSLLLQKHNLTTHALARMLPGTYQPRDPQDSNQLPDYWKAQVVTPIQQGTDGQLVQAVLYSNEYRNPQNPQRVLSFAGVLRPSELIETAFPDGACLAASYGFKRTQAEAAWQKICVQTGYKIVNMTEWARQAGELVRSTGATFLTGHKMGCELAKSEGLLNPHLPVVCWGTTGTFTQAWIDAYPGLSDAVQGRPVKSVDKYVMGSDNVIIKENILKDNGHEAEMQTTMLDKLSSNNDNDKSINNNEENGENGDHTHEELLALHARCKCMDGEIFCSETEALKHCHCDGAGELQCGTNETHGISNQKNKDKPKTTTTTTTNTWPTRYGFAPENTNIYVLQTLTDPSSNCLLPILAPGSGLTHVCVYPASSRCDPFNGVPNFDYSLFSECSDWASSPSKLETNLPEVFDDADCIPRTKVGIDTSLMDCPFHDILYNLPYEDDAVDTDSWGAPDSSSSRKPPSSVELLVLGWFSALFLLAQ